MSKYVVFGWTDAAKREGGPADELLGTSDGEEFADDDYTYWRDDWVSLSPYLMGGKNFLMKVLYTHQWHLPVVAYYQIPRSER